VPEPVISIAFYESPIGLIEIRGGDEGLASLNFVAAGAAAAVGLEEGGLPAPLAEVLSQLDEYFRGLRTSFSVRLDLRGTAFQMRVWSELLRVEYGHTTTYKALAAAIGRPASTRAVGGANHRNPVSIIVPCHRVVGTDGRLTGYGGGLWRKAWLLGHERGDPLLELTPRAPAGIK
jgi:methylated-DNA-[protein]-cysteine S-methyltransferase